MYNVLELISKTEKLYDALCVDLGLCDQSKSKWCMKVISRSNYQLVMGGEGRTLLLMFVMPDREQYLCCYRRGPFHVQGNTKVKLMF